MRARVRWGVAIAGGIVLACAAPEQLRYESALEQAPPAAAHAIHDERLHSLMHDLDRLRNERLPKSMDEAEIERRQVQELVEIARAMAASAAQIPDTVTPELEGPEREEAERELAALALQLEERATRFADRAPELRPDERAAELEALDATCAACHSRFRVWLEPHVGH